MAQNQVSASLRYHWAAKNRETTGSSANSAETVATPANYTSMAALDARLLAIGGMYTQTVIDQMTSNDKEYAVRLNDDNGTL